MTVSTIEGMLAFLKGTGSFIFNAVTLGFIGNVDDVCQDNLQYRACKQ